MTIQHAITPLLWRVIAFLGLFVLISGLAGPRIIANDIMVAGGFEAYGSLGKAAIFGLVAFVLLVRHNKTKFALQPWQPQLLGWFVGAGIAFIVAWLGINALLAGQRDVLSLLMVHGGLVVSVACAAAGCFGLKNMHLLWRTYRRELMLSAIIAALFYVFLLVVYALWKPIAWVVLYSVNWLLGLTGLITAVIPPNVLMLDKFGITIAEYCSGIESIALFTGLYVVVGMLDWPRLHKKRYFSVFPFALLVLFGLNIVRVYGLIVAGYFINPDIAFSLFHTYAGLVFFIIYSLVFWSVAYKYLVPKQHHEPAA